MLLKPASVIWIAKYLQTWENKQHRHSYFQLLYIIGGKSKIFIEDQCIDLKTEHIYLLPPNIKHSICCSDTEPLRTIDVKFTVNDKEVYLEILKLPFEIVIDNNLEIGAILENLVKEAISEKYLYRKIIDSNFFFVLLKILRYYNGANETEEYILNRITGENTHNGVVIRDVREYIDRNYGSDITLEALSKMANVNRTYLINYFKQIYGVTPMKYLNMIRIRKAKELLQNTDLNITEISEIVGFKPIHYFSRYFKEKENYSPLEYRQKYKNIFIIQLDEMSKNFL
jgi:AraC-like DNA-binding protein/mannose-6-phosphate isomerase-like protein (cupin superfamily)